MSLLRKAEDVLRYGHLKELFGFLEECLNANSVEALAAVQRLYEDDYDGITFNAELKAHAAYSLAFWGERGLDALTEAAKRNPSYKSILIALQMLATLAAGETRPPLYAIGVSQNILDKVNSALATRPSFPDAARHRLNDIVLSIADDDEAASRVGLLIQMFSYTGGGAVKQLFAALASRWLAISKPTLTRFEALIQDHPEDEPRFQKFLEAHPQLLDPMALQVWPRPDFHGFKEPDFVIRRTDNSYVVVEIETPAKMLVTGDNQISAQVTQAVRQVMEYRTFLTQRYQEASAYFPMFQEPEGLVVIGLEGTLKDEQRKALLMENEHRHRVRIVGFDWIARRAEAITQNIIERKVDVQPLRMV